MERNMKPPGTWGEFEENSEILITPGPDDIITPTVKMEKLKHLKHMAIKAEEKIEEMKLKNHLVTQTIEVMNQTEMLQTLIDTYANKSGLNNYMLNPCQMIPQVDFPAENTENLLDDDKFVKPFWYIPPVDTHFTRGVKETYPQIRKEIAREAIRKSISGLLRIAGYNDCSNIALITFTDAVEEFLNNFLLQVNDVKTNQSTELSNKIDILTLEKAYMSMTQQSLTSIHNSLKHQIIARNRSEINEFKDIFQEYDKMMKESQVKFRDNDEFMNFLDFNEGGNVQQGDVNVSSQGNYIKVEGGSNQGNFQDIFCAETEGDSQNQQPSTSIQGAQQTAQPNLEQWIIKQ